MEIRDKIKDALSKLCLDGRGLIIQFWAPIETSCQRQVLSTVDQPFSVDTLGGFQEYRLSCLNYYYCIDNNYNNNKLHIAQEEEDGDDDPMIINSRSFGVPVATAFVDCLPQVVMNPRVAGCSALLRSASQCGLTCFLTIPVFLNQTSSSSVVGVLECSFVCYNLIYELERSLKAELESVGLNTYQPPYDRPFKTIPGLGDAIDEVEAGLELVCASLNLPVAQVWISYENELNHTILSCTRPKPMAGLYMMGYLVDPSDVFKPFISAYHFTCYKLPLNMRDGLAGKTFQTYEPHFCRDVYELRVNGLLGMLHAKVKYSCFVICLRNINTGNLDYAIEFLWPRSRNYLILLESLLLTLKRGLPNFQFASGAQLDDELRVLDVENSTGSGIGSFKILEKNRLLQIPKALEEGKKSVAEDCISSSEMKFKTTSIPLPREDIRQQTGTTGSTRASKYKNNVLGISESQGSNFVKRKLSDLYQEDNRANQDHSFSSNRCLGDEKYNLDPGSDILQFLDFEDEQRMLDVDRASKSCIKCVRTAGTQIFRKSARLITPCLKRASCEIEEALEIVCESHDITLAQVWIPYENDKQLPCSSSVEEPPTKQLFAVKLTGYSVDPSGGLSASLKEYYDTCDVLPLIIGDGLSGKTLQTCEPHFCKNIYELDDKGLLALLPANTECSCLTICLRSIHTGHLDYAFEFIWPHRRFYFFLLKTLFVTLSRCLPNFKFASGAQLGDEISTLKIFYPSDKVATGVRLGDTSLTLEGNTSSQTPDASIETRRVSKEHAETVESESVAFLGDNELIIEAAYGDHGILFYLHRSSNLVHVKMNIFELYKLSPSSYRLEYQWNKLWEILDDDNDWKTCIKRHLQFGYRTIRMLVLSKNRKVNY